MKYIYVLLVIILLCGCKQQTSGQAAAVPEPVDTAVPEGPVEIKIPEGSGPVCYDTDEANDPYTSGYVYGVKADGEKFQVKDSCYHGMLLEYYCEENEYRNQNYRCNCTKEGRICIQ